MTLMQISMSSSWNYNKGAALIKRSSSVGLLLFIIRKMCNIPYFDNLKKMIYSI